MAGKPNMQHLQYKQHGGPGQSKNCIRKLTKAARIIQATSSSKRYWIWRRPPYWSLEIGKLSEERKPEESNNEDRESDVEKTKQDNKKSNQQNWKRVRNWKLKSAVQKLWANIHIWNLNLFVNFWLLKGNCIQDKNCRYDASMLNINNGYL